MITVLLATYNGEKYLECQLDSLLEQTYRDFTVLIGDDGSTDGTLDIIKRYVGKYPEKIKLLEGKSLGGAKHNFFRLLQAAPDGYVMFCDQDDKWLPEKIEKTYKKMLETEQGDENTPVLVHSDLYVTDGELNVISGSFVKFQAISPERVALNEVLTQNSVTGCTAMINGSLLSLLRHEPEVCPMHDWWAAAVVSAFGKTAFIREPLSMYRQHGDNSVGAKNAKSLEFLLGKFKNRAKVRENYREMFGQARSMLSLFSDKLSEKDVEILTAFASLENLPKCKKIKVLRRYGFKKNTFIRNIGQYFSI